MKTKWWKKFSAFELVSMILICVLVVVVVVTAIVIADKKSKIDDMRNKNEEVKTDSTTFSPSETNLLNQIEKYNQP